MKAALAKAKLRAEQLAALREISPAQRAAWSEEIMAQILVSSAWEAARTVLIYAPLGNEPDLLGLIGPDRRMLVPRLAGTLLTLHEITDAPRQLVRSQSFLREPTADCPAVDLGAVDLAFIPGLAFARGSLLRLGRGGGYYDRLLGNGAWRARNVGVGFACQLLADLPQEPHDCAMAEIITEQRLD